MSDLHPQSHLHKDAPTIISSTEEPVPVPTTRITSGQHLGTYRLVRRLGRGAMGQVFEAVDERLGRRVAIKVLSDYRVDGEAAERFRREALHIARLRHPNIVGVLDVGRDNDRPYLVMDLVEGITLSQALRERRLSYRAKALFLAQVAHAIQHAHDQGIVHRDLKPANIMVEHGGPLTTSRSLASSSASRSGTSTAVPDDDTILGEPRVMDFGLALDATGSAQLSLDGKAIGTPSYMPPEQAAGQRRLIGPRSDVYSLGAILYEMITGRPPFLGEQVVQVLQAVVDADPVRPSALAPDVPRDLETICLHCLEKDRNHRYASAADLASDLEAWLRGDPIMARPASAVERFAKRLRKHPIASTLVAGCVALLVIGTTVSMVLLDLRARDAERARDEASLALTRLREESEARLSSERHQQRLLEERERDWILVFSDDFSLTKPSPDWEFIGAEPVIRDGWLRMEGGKPQVAAIRKGYTGDLRLEFDCRLRGDFLNDVSCVIAARSEDLALKGLGGYHFKYGGFSNTRNSLYRLRETLWNEGARPLVADQIYHVVAERDDGRLRYTINGQVIFDVRDEDPLVGWDRSRIAIYGWQAITEWDNVRLWRRGEPVAADLLDVAQRSLTNRNLAAAEQLFGEVATGTSDPHRRLIAEAGLGKARQLLDLERRRPEFATRMQQWWPKLTVTMQGQGWLVDFGGAGSASLEPLRGAPLSGLIARGLPISDLTPIVQDQLRHLDCSFSSISDLSVLSNCPNLTKLEIAGCRIADIRPLTGLPLRHLDLSECPVTDIAALRSLPLSTLLLSGTNVRDLSVLAGMNLRDLDVSDLELTDLEALRGLPLQFLTCNNNSIESLDALRGMRLRHLRCEHNRIDDLEPLRGMSLEHLDLTGNRVSDLEPLRGMGISILHLEYNAISDLGPLQGMPASRFLLNGNRISDLSPLAHSPIHAINVADNPLGNLGQLLQHPPLVVHLPHTLDQALLTAAIAAWPDHASPGRNARLIELLRRNDLAQLREAICPSGSQYGLLPIWHSYPEAKAVAGRMGGHLLCLESPGEEAAVGELLATHEFGSSPIWLGCEIDEGQGRWVTGTSLDPQRFPLRTHDSGVLRLSPSDDRSWLMTHPIDVERCVAAVVIEFPPPQP